MVHRNGFSLITLSVKGSMKLGILSEELVSLMNEVADCFGICSSISDAHLALLRHSGFHSI